MNTSWSGVASLQVVFGGLVISLCISGCVGTASREHVDDEKVLDVEASNVDIRAMSRKMAAAIIELPFISQNPRPVTVAFLRIENRTDTVDFDSYNLLSSIRGELLANGQGKLVFLDDKATEAILAQRDAKRSGQLTSSTRESLPGCDYFLTGYAYSQRKVGDDATIEASHRYEFHLTDAETGAIRWQDQYEFKKYGRRGSAYQGR